MQRVTTLELYAYWDQLRAGRLAPHRFEIEPSAIAQLLPETFILECDDARQEASYRYRLAGTKLCEYFSREFRNEEFLNPLHGQDRITILRRLALLRDRAAVLSFQFEVVNQHGQTAVFECVLLPLLHRGSAVERFLGCMGPVDEPSWLGHVPIIEYRLGDHDIIWPRIRTNPNHIMSNETNASLDRPNELDAPRSGHAYAASQLVTPTSADNGPVLHPRFREARIVRQERRQFRVYDGGLSDIPRKPR